MKNKFEKFGKTGVYMQLLIRVGSIMMLSILFFFGIGLLVLKTFKLNVGFIIVFVFTGVALGFYNVYREIQKLE